MVLQKDLLTSLKEDEPDALQRIFNEYWQDVFALAISKTGDPVLAEEITQDIFVSLWENRFKIRLESHLKHYLLGSVKFQVINHYKSSALILAHRQKFSLLMELETGGTADEKGSLFALRMFFFVFGQNSFLRALRGAPARLRLGPDSSHDPHFFRSGSETDRYCEPTGFVIQR